MASVEVTMPATISGIAAIKSEFLLYAQVPDGVEPEAKRVKVEGSEKKKARGQNKGRYYHNKGKRNSEIALCSGFVDVRVGAELPLSCIRGEHCKYSHDIQLYLSSKLPDIGPECYCYKTKGHCRRGVTCRYGSQHLTEDGRNKISDAYKEVDEVDPVILKKDLQIALRKKTYDFGKANAIVDEVWTEVNEAREKEIDKKVEAQNNGLIEVMASEQHAYKAAEDSERESEGANNEETSEENAKVKIDIARDLAQKASVVVIEEGSVSDKPGRREKKIIDWRGKLYLAPLTTLGNLPFRRVCKEWGADITCGEMAMAPQILQGTAHEWALLRRHESETLFGVQICGSNPHVLTRCAQLIEETTDIDFIDLNLGCPIELVYRKGGGSGLLRREKQLSVVVNSMARVTNVPITVKTRSGVYEDKNVAHTFMPLYTAAGVSLIVVHGRTREQRYTRTADWDYIEECASLAAPTPVFGNGDILSFSDYNRVMSSYPHVAGAMIGRGALYKPWIFTEIKEQRDWDISSAERLDILRKFTNYGFEHWGSDTKGVENTRRFLLEWLSFLHRYIPVGLLERPPQRINERPPRYIGRNDLETLMASPNCADWVKISELLCGPVPEGFDFLPKHKASAWASG